MSRQAKSKIAMISAALLVCVVAGGVTRASGILTWSQIAAGDQIPESAGLVQLGERIYKEACFTCHGDAGKGDGVNADYLFTRPRDFTTGTYKVRSTATGSPPTDEDLFRSITVGFPEFGMPRFEYLSAKERWALVYYVKQFDPRMKTDEILYPSDVGDAPGASAQLLAQGKQLYADAECGRCHGALGRGDGPSAATLRDDSGFPSRVAAFALGPRAFKRGSSPHDIAVTFMTGLAGTPMPSYDEALTKEQAWAIAYYVESLAKKQ